MLKKFALLFFLFLLLILGGVWFAAGSLSAPVPARVGNCPADLVCENVSFQSASGANIKGWLVAGETGRGAVVLLHGVRANRLSLLDRMRFLRRAGYAVLAFDFQGSGESVGQHITFGHLESRDVTAALKFLRARQPGEKIGVVGISLGGAAFLLQTEPQSVDALILEMVYPTMRRAVENRLNLWLFSGAGHLAPLLTAQLPLRLGVSVEELRPLDKVASLSTPTLFIVGENDQHTTLAESREFFAAKSEPKELWMVPQAEHTDLLKFTPQDYEQKVLAFFEKPLRK